MLFGHFHPEDCTSFLVIKIPNSTFGIANLLAGGFDMAAVTADNIYNARFNNNQNISIIGQLDQGAGLVIASRPNITSIEEFRGTAFLVDSPLSGYSYVLCRYGLRTSTDTLGSQFRFAQNPFFVWPHFRDRLLVPGEFLSSHTQTTL